MPRVSLYLLITLVFAGNRRRSRHALEFSPPLGRAPRPSTSSRKICSCCSYPSPSLRHIVLALHSSLPTLGICIAAQNQRTTSHCNLNCNDFDFRSVLTRSLMSLWT